LTDGRTPISGKSGKAKEKGGGLTGLLRLGGGVQGEGAYSGGEQRTANR